MIRHVFKVVQDVDLPSPFPIMTWTEAMRRYGSDKPDLRVNLEFTDMTDVMRDVDFKVFAAAATAPGSRVVALRVGRAEMSRSEIDAYTQFVGIYGAKGLAYIKVNEVAKGRDGLQSPIVKNLHDAALAELIKRTGAQDGDIIFFGADREKVVNDAIGAAREDRPQRIRQEDRPGDRRLEAAVGGRFPDVRIRRGRRPLHRCPSPVHQPQATATRTSSNPIRARPSPRPTTWC